MDEFRVERCVHLWSVDGVVGGGRRSGRGEQRRGRRRVRGVVGQVAGAWQGWRGCRADWDLLQRRGGLLDWSLKGQLWAQTLDQVPKTQISRITRISKITGNDIDYHQEGRLPDKQRQSAVEPVVGLREDSWPAGPRPLETLYFDYLFYHYHLLYYISTSNKK